MSERIYERGPWLFHFVNEWPQLRGGYNWYTFRPLSIEFEIMGGAECTVVVMGLGFRLRYNAPLPPEGKE